MYITWWVPKIIFTGRFSGMVAEIGSRVFGRGICNGGLKDKTNCTEVEYSVPAWLLRRYL
jgi:hypothetical protein